MDFDLAYVNEGVKTGQARCSAQIPKFMMSEDVMKQVNSVIVETLQKEPTEWHPRAISLFSEVVTIGGLSRSHYGEKEVTVSLVVEFLGALGKILNSFTHK